MALSLTALPFVLGFSGLDAIYYWATGAAVLLVTVALAAPERQAIPLAAA